MFKSRAKRLFARHKRHQQQLIEQQQQQQSAMKQQYFDSKRCHRTYSCAHCRAHLADHDQLVSKLFQGNHGRAYLFNKVINIGCKQAIQRELLTGLHAVADIYCDSCETTVGWKYEQAFVASQKYKEGKYIIESIHMLKENNWDLTSYNARELIRRDATRLDELADLCAASFCLNDDVADDNQAIKGQLPSNGLRPGEPAASEAIGAAAADAAANRCDDISGMDSRQLHDAAIDDGDDDDADADADADAAAAANRTSSSCSVVIMRQPTDTTPQRTANGGSAAHLGDDSTTLSAGEHFGDNRRRPEIDGQHEMAAKASDPSELITIRVDQTTRAKRR